MQSHPAMGEIARPVPTFREMRHNHFYRACCLRSAVIRIADDAGSLGNVDEARAGWRPKSNPERLVQMRSKDGRGPGMACASLRPPNQNPPGTRLCKKHVAVRGCPQRTGRAQSGRPELDGEAFRNDRCGSCRSGDDARPTARRSRGVERG